jgi:hypothetical protein
MTSDVPPDLPTQEDVRGERQSDSVRTVLITGAAGGIGRKPSAAWTDRYHVIRLDQHTIPTIPT